MLSPSVEQLEQIDHCLDTLRQKAGMRCVMLVDHSGQLISQRGPAAGTDTTALAVLAAAELSATREIARLVGERKTFKQLFHDGDEWRVIVDEVGGPWLLVGVVDTEMLLGWVRLAIRQASETLAECLREVHQAACLAANGPSRIVDDEFGDALAEQMAQAFDSEMGVIPQS
jgi:predicted regulator of Ras-like GTPase activity (Roadblock/LC7/MglB family)